MSKALNKIPTVKVLEPTIDIYKDQFYAILEGGSEISYRNLRSTSFDNNSANFSTPPPSPNIFVDRQIMFKMRVSFDFAGTSQPGQNLIQSGFDSLRSYPLSSIINTLSATINNTNADINMSDVIQPLLHYYGDEVNQEWTYSTTPSMMDQSQSYDELVNSVRNPLASYLDSSDLSAPARGGFPLAAISLFENNETDAHLEFDLAEFLFLSPFSYSKKKTVGFIGVQNMQFTFNYVQDLANKLWCHSNASGSTLTNITVNFNDPQLLFRYVTPKDVMQIPRSISYPYYVIQRYFTTGLNPIAPGATTIINSNNIQLQSIPAKFYIFVRKQRSQKTFLDTDSYFGIQSVAINWDNRSGILSNASQQDLYQIARQNGLNMSWKQFSGEASLFASGSENRLISGTGSVLCLIPGKDMPLNSIQAPGLLQTTQFQLALTVKNVHPTESITPELVIITEVEGIWQIENNLSIAQIGVISREDILDSATSPMVDYYDYFDNLKGGDFFKDVKKTLSDVWQGIKTGIKDFTDSDFFRIAKQVVPMIAKVLGSGEMQYDQAGKLIGGKYKKGGKLLSRQQLHRRIQEL